MLCVIGGGVNVVRGEILENISEMSDLVSFQFSNFFDIAVIENCL